MRIDNIGIKREKDGEMWSKLVEKAEMQKDPKEFWKGTGKMLGTAKKKTEGAKFIKNENGVEMRTSEEIVTAFRRRLMKTFSINEEDNELFCKRTEREVEE